MEIIKTPPIARGILPAESEMNAVSLHMLDIGDHSYLSIDEELTLFKRLDEAWPGRLDNPQPKITEAGKKIRAEIASHNFKLVVSLAKRPPIKNLEYSDLIQEGNEGLLRAINKFDPSRGYRLTTYATWWIRQAVGRAVHNLGRTIRVPVHMGDVLKKIRGFESDYLKQYGYAPTVDEVAKKLGMPPEKVIHCLTSTQYTESLDTLLIDEEEKGGSYDILPNDDCPDPTEAIDNHNLRYCINQVLASFTPREQRIIEMRYGLGGYGGRAYTLEEIGLKFQITRERVRQIQSEVLRRLRHPRYARMLRVYLDDF